jgi:hypothetical protein
MEIESLILGIIIAALAVLIVLWPFVAPPREWNRSPRSSRLETLVMQRDAIYATIRDLDFDYETGKLEEADYRAQREDWVVRGVEVLKALDALRQSSGPVGTLESGGAVTDVGPDLALDAQIEAAVASRRHAT